MKLTSILAFSVISCGLVGCVSVALQKPGVVAKKYTRFGMELPGAPWKVQAFRDADIFLEHKDTGASIFVNSQCEDIKESPLEALRAQILIGFENVEIQKQERIKLGEREALVSEIQATMDGVPRFLKIMVLRKNRCIFDAVLSSEKNIPSVTQDFDKMLATFWAEAEL